MHDPSRVRVSGPLEVFAAGFAAELARLGYRRTPATFQLQLMAHASRWLAARGSARSELTSEVVERFLAERRAAGYTNYVTARAMAPLLGYLRGLGVAPAGVAARGGRRGRGAAGRLSRVPGRRARADGGHDRGLRAGGQAVPGRSLAGRRRARPRRACAAADVVAFVVERCPAQSRGAAKMTVTGLRSLLGFLHLRGSGRWAAGRGGAVDGVVAAVGAAAGAGARAAGRAAGVLRPRHRDRAPRLRGAGDARAAGAARAARSPR